MTQESLTDAGPALRPIAVGERIQALDVVRGFALIGIFLMNIEFFNRATSEIGIGLPTTLQGLDWWAGYLVYVLVQGKFWTMFSLLFGMGFAVMLTRAERAGRAFLKPYLRRIAALAVFGAAHHIFLWSGDILFSYAVGAVCLLLLLWMRWWVILLLAAALAIGAGVSGINDLGEIAAGLFFMMLGASFLNTEGRVGSLPWLSLVFFLVAVALLAAAGAAGAVPNFPADARWPCVIGSGFFWLLGALSWRYKDPVEARPRRLGGTMYLLMFAVMLAFGALQVYGPARPQPTEAQVAAAVVELKAEQAKEEAAKGKPAPSRAEQQKAAEAKMAKAQKMTPEQRVAMEKAQGRIQLAKHEAKVVKENRLATTGSYVEMVRYRAEELLNKAAGEFIFAVMIVGMFLLGYWFVRTGIMEKPAEHLPLFRKMALIGIPLGVGAGILASLIATHATPGLERDPYQMAMAITMLGNLPACLGYVGMVVLMLHSSGALRKIAVLAPLGRMALTNYLTQSLVCSLVFYGYAGGQYGMGRAAQVGFVFAVIALQLVFSHWWLSKFRYGPMEWLWRAITYWQVPEMRREAAPQAVGAAA